MWIDIVQIFLCHDVLCVVTGMTPWVFGGIPFSTNDVTNPGALQLCVTILILLFLLLTFLLSSRVNVRISFGLLVRISLNHNLILNTSAYLQGILLLS